jgi:dihydrofolate reductase
MTAIVAVDRRWGIGRGDSLLFRIPPDMKRFRQLTLNKTVVMGHSTFLTMPKRKPLDRRNNIIISRDVNLTIEGATVVNSVQELFSVMAGIDSDSVFVIGGESVYRLLLPYLCRVYVTKIYETAADADKIFTDLDHTPHFTSVPLSDINEDNEIRFQYYEYTNDAPRKPDNYD